MRGTVISLFFILCWTALPAQQPDTQKVDYDSLTLINYINADWGSLVSNSKFAIENGFETVTIRKRLAYGLYRQGNYFGSIRNYRLIHLQNASDQDALLMLYENYTQLGRTEEANYYLRYISEELKNSQNLRESHLFSIADLSSGISLNSNIADNENLDIRQGGVYGQQSLNGELYYLQGGVKLYPKHWLNMYFSVEDVQMKKTERISASVLKLTGTTTDFYQGQKFERNLYRFQDTTHLSNTFVNQRLAYAELSFLKPELFTIRIFGNYLMNRYSVASSKYRLENYVAQPIDTFYSVRTIYSFADTVHTDYEYIFGGSLEKNFNSFQFGFNTSYSNLNKKKQILSRAELYWFPKGNTRFSVGGSLAYLMEENSVRWLPEINTTIQVCKIAWLSLSAMNGDLSNTAEFNGLVVHNSTDKTVFRLGSGLFLNLSRHFNFNFTFHYSQKKNNFITYPQADRFIITEKNYNTYLLALGLKYSL